MTRDGKTWTCRNCGEVVDDDFDACWNCVTDRVTGERLPGPGPEDRDGDVRQLAQAKHVSRSWVAKLLAIGATYCMYTAWQAYAVREPSASFLEILPLIILSAVLGSLALWLSRQHAIDVQHARDVIAERVFEGVRSGTLSIAYALYLRSFVLDGLLVLDRPYTTSLLPEHYDMHEPQLETIIADAIRERLPLVALGAPGGSFGAGRMPVVVSEWQHLAASLMQAATVIIVVPFLTSGTLWELDYLS
jgi:hypothetical protein